MSSDLYEVLGLERNATAEDIRKAYKKRALKTHPDRLPQGVSDAERQRANEQFRLVNNAYEVLNDPNNRRLYDQHGIWPPPTAAAQPTAGPSFRQSGSTFSAFEPNNPFETDPFFTGRPFGHPTHTAFTFTDPFELFHSLFGDIHHMRDDFNDPFFGHSPFLSSPVSAFTSFGTGMGPHDPWDRSLMAQFGAFAGRPMLSSFTSSTAMAPNMRSYSSTTQSMGSGGHSSWVSQSTMTRSINGRTETITTRRDAQGNEHVTYSSPEGERYTINGVEQHTNRPLPSSSAAPAALPSTSFTNGPPVPIASRTQSRHSKPLQTQDDTSRRSSSSSYPRAYDSGHSSSRESEHKSIRKRDDQPSPSSSRAKKKHATSSGDGHHVGDNGDVHGRHRRSGW